MLLPGEDIATLETETRVWELLASWAGPDSVELVRHKVYNFRSLIASRWRDRRLLIAGDAAHVMPPFMGQGMCSGMRDAWNLAWKLGLILDGKSGDALLDTYQRERGPHVSQVTDISIYLGKIICIPDAEAAAERDRAFLGGTAPPPAPFPHLADGFIRHGVDGLPMPGAGLLAPHVDITLAGRMGRLDDVVGGGFLLITRGFDAAVAPALAKVLAAIGTRHVALNTPGGATETHGRLDAFMAGQGWLAMAVRPDYYVYGGAASVADLPAMLADMINDLRRYGLSVADPSDKVKTGDSYEVGAI